MDTPDKTVHQHITNEAQEVWNLIPFEIKQHLNSSLSEPVNDKYDANKKDDIITGSAEEDKASDTISHGFGNHFWNPDNPDTILSSDNDDYNDGLGIVGSSYRKSLGYWSEKIIPMYRNGDKDEAYYWLGRVAHLLQDAAVPAHVQLDPHGPTKCGWPEDDSTECYTSDHWDDYNGLTLANQEYNYDNLPNMSGFNWGAVEPTNKQHIELFKLFWYTAQKTQYYASDDEDSNDKYRKVGDGTLYDFSDGGYDLWSGEGVTMVSDNSALPNFWENYDIESLRRY